MFLLTNERYKTYQTGFSFGRLGHAPGVGLGGTIGGGGGGGLGVNFFFSKFNQILCVSYLHEWNIHRHNFWVPAPGALVRGKRSNSIKSEIKSISNIFKPNFMYLLTNERYITYQTRLSFGHLVMPRDGTWGYHGGLGVKKIFFSEIQPDLLCELLT